MACWMKLGMVTHVSATSADGGVLFRVASSPTVGGGHVSRCLAIADALARRVPVLMVLDADATAAEALCKTAGIPAMRRDPFDMTASWQACVLDGYAFSASEIDRYAALAPLVVMDDFGHPPAQAALAVNSAFHLAGETMGAIPALLGARYAPVAPRFAALHRGPEPDNVRNVLITFGRVDPENATGLALEAVSLLADQGMALRITAVAATHAQSDAIRERHGAKATILTEVQDMAPLLAETDLVIGAGGVSLYERMAAGVPSVSLVIADNQRMLIEGAAGAGATCAAGDASELPAHALAEIVQSLCADRAARQRMSDRARALIDGQGAERVADAILRIGAARRQAASA